MSRSLINTLLTAFVLVLASAEVIDVDLTGDRKDPRRRPKDDEQVVGLIDPVLHLNRVTFQNTILDPETAHIPHWIVMFCPSWHDKCQGLMPSYELLGVQWENKLNKALMSSTVRFAKVDCATEKALCVSLDIDDYPSVVHYRNHQRAASWHGGAPGLVRFVKEALEGPKRRPHKHSAAKAKSFPTCALDGTSSVGADEQPQSTQPWLWARAACFGLMLIGALRCIWIFCSPRASCEKSQGSVDHSRGAKTSSLQKCLPQEWARDRSGIVL